MNHSVSGCCCIFLCSCSLLLLLLFLTYHAMNLFRILYCCVIYQRYFVIWGLCWWLVFGGPMMFGTTAMLKRMSCYGFGNICWVDLSLMPMIIVFDPYGISVISHVRPAITKTLAMDITLKLFDQFLFTFAMLIGTINFYHFRSFSLTLTLAGGHKLSAK